MLWILAYISLIIGPIVLIVGLILMIIGFFSKSTRRKLVSIGLSMSILSTGVVGAAYYYAAIDMQNLPTGTLLEQLRSPTGAYTLDVYLVEGGMTVENPAVRVAVVYNDSTKHCKNIYWDYGEGDAKIHWVNAQTVSINGHVLNVLHSTYDSRHGG